TVTWSSSDPYVAMIAAGGLASSWSMGTTSISATAGSVTGTANLTVTRAAVVGLNITPATVFMSVGSSLQLQAIATLSDGTTQSLTGFVAWSSTQPGIASVSSGGLVTAGQVGATTILAEGNGFTGSASFTVASPIALNIVPSTLSMVLGSSSQLQAIATLSNGATQDLTGAVAWSSAQPGIASVNSSGLATANQVGSTTIFAQVGGVTGSVSVTVTPLLLVNYFNAAYAQASGIDGAIRLTNPGLTGGNLCAMVYVFDRNQVLNECCGCSISDDGMRTFSLLLDLTANPLPGITPQAGIIEIVSSDPTQNPQCDPSSLAPAGEILGWETHDQPNGDGTFQVTETSFAQRPLGGEATVLENECAYLKQLGSGAGICSCGSGD